MTRNSFINQVTIPLFIIFFLLGTGFSYLFFKFDQSRIEVSWQTRSTFSYLFIMEDEKGDYLFSTVYVYNIETDKGFFIDLPKEVAYEKYGEKSFSWLGKLYKGSSPKDFLIQVSYMVGETIDFYFIFNPQNLSQLVDLLSGVPFFSDEEFNSDITSKSFLPSGQILLDGDKANEYIHYYSDLSSHDQRYAFMQAFLDLWVESKSDIVLNKVSQVFYSFLETNIPSSFLMNFLLEKWVSPKENTLLFYVKGPKQKIVEENIEVIFPTALSGENLLREQMRKGMQYINDYNKIEDIAVEVLNATDRAGLAKKVANSIEYLGYRIIKVGNADKNSERSVVIRNGSKDLSKARIFSSLLKIEDIKMAEEAESSAEVTIILGSDFDEKVIQE